MPDMATEQSERDPGLQFFGRVTAGATHELNNVLSIIEQMAGLLEDQVEMTAHGQPLDPQRIASVLPRIERQIDRGADLLRNLNRYAHTVDQVVASVDANDLAEMLLSLTARFANLFNVTVHLEPACEHVLIDTDVYGLLHTLFELSRAIFAEAERGDKVILKVDPEDGHVAFRFNGTPVDRFAGNATDQRKLTSMAEMLGGRFTTHDPATGAVQLAVRLPARVIAGLS